MGNQQLQQGQNSDSDFVIPDREPEPTTVKESDPTTVATTTEFIPTDRHDFIDNRSAKVDLPPCDGGSGYLCGTPRIPHGWANRRDPLFQHIKTTHLNARVLNTVHCSTERPGSPGGEMMVGGRNTHTCIVKYNDRCSSEFVLSYCNGCFGDVPRLDSKSV